MQTREHEMDNYCLCDIVTEDIDEVDIMCESTHRSIHASISDDCLVEMTQSDALPTINYLQAKLNRLDEMGQK